MQATQLCTDRKYGAAAIKGLWTDIRKYQSLADPFSLQLAKGEAPRLGRHDPNKLIVKIARSILSIKPHATDPEQAFSFMCIIHISIRNHFKANTVGSMAQIKSYLLIPPPDEV